MINVRDDLAGLTPYGAPQIDVPVRLNTNENPYPPSPRMVRAIADAVAEAAGTLNRYPDRDATELRKDLADYLGHGLTAAPLALIEAVCAAAPGLVVVDEAYAEFAREGTPSALTLLPRYPHLVVTRTMSKAFAMAGARVGYLAAAPGVVEKLLVVRLPYHLSAVTQAVARAALALAAEPLATVTSLRAERDELVTWLRHHGLSVADSDANFVLFGEFDARREVWQALLDRGVLVREVGPPRWLRVTVGTPEEMAAFRIALEGVLAL